MTELKTITPAAELSQEEATRIRASWQALAMSQSRTADELAVVSAEIFELKSPANPQWIMARVASLLSQYYAADVPPAAVAMMAEDWLEALRDFPQWAITDAVRWWKSADNPDRKKRPLEGDIAARCQREFGAVTMADRMVDRGPTQAQQPWQGPPEPPRPVPDEASRARVAAMVAELGTAKRVGGAK